MMINHHHIARAIEAVRWCKYNGAALFEGGLRPDKKARAVTIIISRLTAAGQLGVRQKDLYERVRRFVSTEEFEQIIRLMHELEMVNIYRGLTDTGKGRPYSLIKGTKKIGHNQLREVVNVEVFG